MKIVSHIALLLVIIGALNWGSIGLFDKNFVNMLLGQWPKAENVTYILVGVAAILKAICWIRCCCSSHCHTESSSSGCCRRDDK